MSVILVIVAIVLGQPRMEHRIVQASVCADVGQDIIDQLVTIPGITSASYSCLKTPIKDT